MATSKSGKKSAKQAEVRRVFNMRRLRAMRAAVKQVVESAQKKDTAAAEKALPGAFKAIDKAAKRGVIKKNAAARKKSQLTKAATNTE